MNRLSAPIDIRVDDLSSSTEKCSYPFFLALVSLGIQVVYLQEILNAPGKALEIPSSSSQRLAIGLNLRLSRIRPGRNTWWSACESDTSVWVLIGDTVQ